MTYSQFTCPDCGQQLDVPSELLGQTVECPSCQGQLSFPKPAIPTEVESHVSHGSEWECPLCERAAREQHPRTLYGHLVCKNCYHGFAFRRHLAFVLDVLCWQVLMIPVVFIIVLKASAVPYVRETWFFRLFRLEQTYALTVEALSKQNENDTSQALNRISPTGVMTGARMNGADGTALALRFAPAAHSQVY